MLRAFLVALDGEEGHGVPLFGALVAAVGAIVLAVGATGDNNAIIIAGGIVLAVGILAVPVLAHLTIDYGIYGRLEALEKQAKPDKE